MLVCDMCDKGYHTFCLQPAMDSLPTNGWRCKVGKDESLLHATVSELPHSRKRERETVKYTSSREHITKITLDDLGGFRSAVQPHDHVVSVFTYVLPKHLPISLPLSHSPDA